MSFANRVAPGGLGGIAVNERYLERSGMPRVEAVTAVTVTSLSGRLVHAMLLLAAALAVSHRGIPDNPLPHHGQELVVVLIVLIALGLVARLPFLRRGDDTRGGRRLSGLAAPRRFIERLRTPAQQAWTDWWA